MTLTKTPVIHKYKARSPTFLQPLEQLVVERFFEVEKKLSLVGDWLL